MNLEEFMAEVAATQRRNKSYRYGQALFSTLAFFEPAKALEICNTPADPYYAHGVNDLSITKFFSTVFGNKQET